jgi:2-(1,2-epoxy-1,2-dihydrophenyl)acetyl-CoA isomerase
MTSAAAQPPTLAGVTVTLNADTEVCVVELNVPDKLNAISGAMLDSLVSAMDWVDAGNGKCVLLRGAGTAFSAGADLESFFEEVDVSRPESADDFLLRWIEVAHRIRNSRVPTLAAVHGVAYGGGLNVALACDIVMAARSTRLCQPYIRIGATADVGASWLLPQLVGIAQARRLILTGEPVEAPEAHAMGMIAYVVDDDALVADSEALAARLATLDAAAMKANRALLTQDEPSSLEAALGREIQSNHDRVASSAFAESLARFRRS